MGVSLSRPRGNGAPSATCGSRLTGAPAAEPVGPAWSPTAPGEDPFGGGMVSPPAAAESSDPGAAAPAGTGSSVGRTVMIAGASGPGGAGRPGRSRAWSPADSWSMAGRATRFGVPSSGFTGSSAPTGKGGLLSTSCASGHEGGRRWPAPARPDPHRLRSQTSIVTTRRPHCKHPPWTLGCRFTWNITTAAPAAAAWCVAAAMAGRASPVGALGRQHRSALRAHGSGRPGPGPRGATVPKSRPAGVVRLPGAVRPPATAGRPPQPSAAGRRSHGRSPGRPNPGGTHPYRSPRPARPPPRPGRPAQVPGPRRVGIPPSCASPPPAASKSPARPGLAPEPEVLHRCQDPPLTTVDQRRRRKLRREPHARSRGWRR